MKALITLLLIGFCSSHPTKHSKLRPQQRVVYRENHQHLSDHDAKNWRSHQSKIHRNHRIGLTGKIHKNTHSNKHQAKESLEHPLSTSKKQFDIPGLPNIPIDFPELPNIPNDFPNPFPQSDPDFPNPNDPTIPNPNDPTIPKPNDPTIPNFPFPNSKTIKTSETITSITPQKSTTVLSSSTLPTTTGSSSTLTTITSTRTFTTSDNSSPTSKTPIYNTENGIGMTNVLVFSIILICCLFAAILLCFRVNLAKKREMSPKAFRQTIENDAYSSVSQNQLLEQQDRTKEFEFLSEGPEQYYGGYRRKSLDEMDTISLAGREFSFVRHEENIQLKIPTLGRAASPLDYQPQKTSTLGSIFSSGNAPCLYQYLDSALEKLDQAPEGTFKTTNINIDLLSERIDLVYKRIQVVVQKIMEQVNQSPAKSSFDFHQIWKFSDEELKLGSKPDFTKVENFDEIFIQGQIFHLSLTYIQFLWQKEFSNVLNSLWYSGKLNPEELIATIDACSPIELDALVSHHIMGIILVAYNDDDLELREDAVVSKQKHFDQLYPELYDQLYNHIGDLSRSIVMSAWLCHLLNAIAFKSTGERFSDVYHSRLSSDAECESDSQIIVISVTPGIDCLNQPIIKEKVVTMPKNNI
ncbi:hypothetical protein BC833DRAFT_584094 [Globomyces pollinis-pini]|nr:hypothetical protein BC833DRAFT_584094 [Globomyces pollinis-pini]